MYNDGKGRDNVYATRTQIGEHGTRLFLSIFTCVDLVILEINQYINLPSSVPRLVFNSHFDTVPPLIPLRQTKDALYGRGVNEAKG